MNVMKIKIGMCDLNCNMTYHTTLRGLQIKSTISQSVHLVFKQSVCLKPVNIIFLTGGIQETSTSSLSKKVTSKRQKYSILLQINFANRTAYTAFTIIGKSYCSFED